MPNKDQRDKQLMKNLELTIDRLFYQDRNLPFCASEKEVCSRILYYLKCLEFLLISKAEFHKAFTKCFSKVLRLNGRKENLAQYSLFSFIGRKYEDLSENFNFPNPDSSTVKARTQLNYGKGKEISNQDKKYLKSKKVNTNIIEITKNQIILQDSQCICCSRVFISSWAIQNLNPYIVNTVMVSKALLGQEKILAKFFSAICNRGGGVVLIGASKKPGGIIYSNGIKFQSQDGVVAKQRQIISLLEMMKPQCKYILQRVLVHSNFTKDCNASQQIMRVCFRIRIVPKSLKHPTYFHQPSSNLSECGQFFTLRDNSLYYISPKQMYQYIHSTYRKHKQPQPYPNSHQNIFCYKPHLYYSKMLYDLYNTGAIQTSYNSKVIAGDEEEEDDGGRGDEDEDEDEEEEEEEEEEDEEQLGYGGENLSDTPKFRYRNQSLLIVTSRNFDKNVELFLNFLNKKNIQNVQKFRPYENTFFGRSSRSIWVLSHNNQYQQLRNYLKDFMRDQKMDPITIIPIDLILQIRCSKFTAFEQRQLQQKLICRFSEYNYKRQQATIFEHKNQSQKRVCYLNFQDRIQSLYAYLIFESLNLRPYFVAAKDCVIKF